MSIKKFNLEEDAFSNEYFNKELVTFHTFDISGSDLPVPNYKLANHYVTGGVSGSWYLDVYDKRNDSVSSNRLMSISYGYTTSSIYFTGNFNPNYQSQKLRMYRLFAKRLLGNENSVFKILDKQITNALFIAIARNQYKDSISVGLGGDDVGYAGSSIFYWGSGSPGPTSISGLDEIVFSEASSVNEFAGPSYPDYYGKALCFVNAGIYVIDADRIDRSGSAPIWSGSYGHEILAKGVSGTTYNDLLWACKHRLQTVYFNSTAKTIASFYRCTAGMNEFNYSSNPTFLGPSKEIITAISATTPTVYFTQIGLLDESGEVLAVAKTKNPVKKHSDVGVIITVRLDY